MIEGIKEIGEYLLSISGKSALAVEIEDPNAKGNYPKMVKIGFSYERELSYRGVFIEDYKKENKTKYLYAKRGGSGANFSPTALVTDDVTKTFNNRIIKWCKNYCKGQPNILNENEKYFLTLLTSVVLDNDNRKKIISDIKEKTRDIREGKIMTFTFTKKGEELYLGDVELFRNLLLYEKQAKYVSHSGQGVCSLCGKETEVFGDTGILKTYTIDKLGFVSGGALKEFTLKNFPLCFDCLQNLREGITFRDQNLNYGFYGHRYYLIPKLAVPDDTLMEQTLDIVTEKYEKAQTLKNGRVIANEEERLLWKTEKLGDQISFIFEFYDPRERGEKILLLMEDVLPSKITHIFKLKRELEQLPVFQNNKIQFDFLNNFFRVPGDKQPKHKDYFFTLVNAAFKGSLINKEHLLNLSMQILRQLFVGEMEHTATLRAFITLLFYQKLGLLKNEGGEIMISESYLEFFKTYEGFFNTPLKRAIFLLGVFAEKLLNYQWTKRGGVKPFRKNLKGLRMAKKDFKGLLPKIQGKFMEYDAYDYPEIREAISHHFLQAGNDWDIGEDELNFCFVLGMNFAGEKPFKTKKEEES